MTVANLLKMKYEDMLYSMKRVTWENFKARAEFEKKHPAELMYMALEITEHDIKAHGGYAGELYAELKAMHEAKLLASNKHRQEHGHVDRWWLTKKGFKELNKTANIV